MPFIEAFRQFQFKVKRENFCNIHVSLIPQVWPSDDIDATLSPDILKKSFLFWFVFCVLSPKLQESRKPNQPRAAFESSEVLVCLQTWWVRLAWPSCSEYTSYPTAGLLCCTVHESHAALQAFIGPPHGSLYNTAYTFSHVGELV